MKKNNIKTFRALLTKHIMGANELAQLVKINGTLYINRWGAWEASLPENDETKDIIETALNEIADYASAVINRHDMAEHYDYFIHHPLDNFGFTIGDNNELFIEKTALQNQQELIAQLQSELTSTKKEADNLRERLNELSSWTGFDDVPEELVPKELDIALQVYSSAIKNYNPETGRMNDDETPKNWLINKVNADFNFNQDTAILRIATVANWKKEAGRPKNSKK